LISESNFQVPRANAHGGQGIIFDAMSPSNMLSPSAMMTPWDGGYTPAGGFTPFTPSGNGTPGASFSPTGSNFIKKIYTNNLYKKYEFILNI
jgi:hypothetical protein